jgi:hypothetical protein
MYPNCDSLIFVIGDYKESLGKLGLHIPYSSDNNGNYGAFGSFVPLSKGSVELRGDKLIVFLKSGSYKEIEINNFITESKISLSKIELNSLNLDSSFIRKGYTQENRNMIHQYPLVYVQARIGDVSDYDGKVILDQISYFFNDNLSIQILPIYDVGNIYFGRPANSYKPPSVIHPMNSVYFNFQRGTYLESGYEVYNETFQKSLRLFFTEIANYFHLKNEGDSKKAMKSLSKANQYLESFKQIYFDPKYDKTE